MSAIDYAYLKDRFDTNKFPTKAELDDIADSLQMTHKTIKS